MHWGKVGRVNEPRDLLQPTLSGDSGGATAIYSATTGYMAAFFGGPLGGAFIALENARRLGRLASDAWIGGVALVSTILLAWWEQRAGGLDWLTAQFGDGAARFGIRLLGLAFFVLAYTVHRKYYRNMAFYGVPSPSGWGIGLAAVVAGSLASGALMVAFRP
jgi:hypothetical protein